MADFSDFGLLIAKYNSTLPTLTDGNLSELQVDSNGRLLVQADVSVVIDFLGLNGASDSSNILIVGTEDGTGTGTSHAVKVASDGSIVISDGASSITVDASNLDIRDLTHVSDSVKIGDGTDFLAIATDGSIAVTDNGSSLTVDATNLDIRDLSASQDNIKISDGTDALEIIADGDAKQKGIVAFGFKDSSGNVILPVVDASGNIPVAATVAVEGTYSYAASDALAAAADGLVATNDSTWADVCTIANTSGTLHIYGWQADCDKNAAVRLITNDGTDTKVYKIRNLISAMPGICESYSKEARIEIAGAASLNVKLQVKNKSGNGQASGSIHARKI
jgi:hypothetical protein